MDVTIYSIHRTRSFQGMFGPCPEILNMKECALLGLNTEQVGTLSLLLTLPKVQIEMITIRD